MKHFLTETQELSTQQAKRILVEGSDFFFWDWTFTVINCYFLFNFQDDLAKIIILAVVVILLIIIVVVASSGGGNANKDKEQSGDHQRLEQEEKNPDGTEKSESVAMEEQLPQFQI